jgi:hypothetical protein
VAIEPEDVFTRWLLERLAASRSQRTLAPAH